MAVLLITYDLNRPGQQYPELYKAIGSYIWKKLSESSYAISTSETTQSVYNKLVPTIDKNDRLFVIELARQWTGWGPQDVYNWLHKYLV